MKSRKYSVIFAILIMVIVSTSVSLAAKPKELNVCVMNNPQSAILKNLLESGIYEKEFGVKVNIFQYSWDAMRQKVLTDFTARVGTYDVIYLDVSWMREYAGLGVLEPLDKQIKGNFELNDFIPVLLNNVGRWNNKLYTIPYESDVAHLFYRKDLFSDPNEKNAFRKKYGYELTVPTTFSQFKDVATFFTRDTDGDGKIDLYGTSHSGLRGSTIWNDWRQYLYAWGGDVVDKQGKPVFNSKESIAAMEYFNSLKPYMPSGVSSMTSGESVRAFTDGKVAMIMEWSAYAVNIVNSKIIDKVGVTVIPKQVRLASGTSGDSLGVYTLSKNKTEAYRFIQWILGKKMMKVTALKGVPPARKSILNDKEVQAVYPNLESFLKMYELGTIVTEPRIAQWDQMRDKIGEALSQALTGSESVSRIFDKAQKEIERFF